MKAKDKGRLPQFVPLLVDTLNSRAWRATSHGSRSLYVALKRRYSSNFKNNGKIFLSQRDAMRELGSGFKEIGNWFRELEHYGFIVQTAGGCLGVDGVGKAPHWRLTEVGYMNELPTKEFLKWDGVKFRRRTPRRKQHPAMETHSAPIWKSIAPALRKTIAVNGTTAMESHSINGGPTAMESHSITSLTTRGPSNPSTLPPWEDREPRVPGRLTGWWPAPYGAWVAQACPSLSFSEPEYGRQGNSPVGNPSGLHH